MIYNLRKLYNILLGTLISKSMQLNLIYTTNTAMNNITVLISDLIIIKFYLKIKHLRFLLLSKIGF